MLATLVFSETEPVMLRTDAVLSEIKTFPREKTLTGAGASFLHDHLYEGACI